MARTRRRREPHAAAQRKDAFRLGSFQPDWAHPQLEEGVVRHGVLPNQQMKPSTGQEGI
jgi:hypothetical protein